MTSSIDMFYGKTRLTIPQQLINSALEQQTTVYAVHSVPSNIQLHVGGTYREEHSRGRVFVVISVNHSSSPWYQVIRFEDIPHVKKHFPRSRYHHYYARTHTRKKESQQLEDRLT